MVLWEADDLWMFILEYIHLCFTNDFDNNNHKIIAMITIITYIDNNRIIHFIEFKTHILTFPTLEASKTDGGL